MGQSTFTYDAIDQLTAALRPPSAPVPDESYSYDAVGNRVSSHRSTTHAHDAANRLTEDDHYFYDYDLNGNLSARVSKTGTLVEEFIHDRENRMVEYRAQDGGAILRRARYFYDGLNRRVGKAVDADGDGPDAPVLHVYLYDGEDVVVEKECGYAGSLDGLGPVGTATGCHDARQWLHGEAVDEPLLYTVDDGVGGHPT